MTSIQLNNTYPEDERWLEAGAVAFALHVAACCYTDRMDKDGLVPKSMVGRIALMVPPSEVESAVDSLVESGFWSSAGRNYRINNYLEDKIGLSAEEKISTRNKWAKDKKLRRQHLNGNHAECSPKTCKYAEVSKVDSTGDSTTESTRKSKGSPRSSTLPEETIPDSTPVGGRGVGMGAAAVPALASAGATAAASSRRELARLRGVPREWLGTDPAALTDLELVSRVYARVVEEDRKVGATVQSFQRWAFESSLEEFIPAYLASQAGAADPADTLDGLIPAGGAGVQ